MKRENVHQPCEMMFSERVDFLQKKKEYVFFQAVDGIRGAQEARGLGDMYE